LEDKDIEYDKVLEVLEVLENKNQKDDEQEMEVKNKKTENKEEELTEQQEAIKKSYECYYCDEFAPTDDRDAYEKHVILTHDGKLAYPSLSDLEKYSLKPQGKNWEI
jgi:hypothetical protein